MLGFNGGLLGKERLATSASLGATGLWLPNEQSVAKRANKWPSGPNEVPAIGAAFQGGFFAGYISHTANGVPTHALIVAPRATGATGTAYPVTTNKTWGSQFTTGASSSFNGRANTDAIIAMGISNYPAAQFCTTLNIGGYTDWYLPALLELDIAYFNLKPELDNNDTTTGINAYSVPARAANYTAGNPARTSVTAFQSTGAEPFATSGVYHWSSTETSSTNARAVELRSGGTNNVSKSGNAYQVRAFRRIAV